MKIKAPPIPSCLLAALFGAVVIGGLYLKTDAQEVDTAKAPPSIPDRDWLDGEGDRRFALVSKHLRGFDVTMVETGHRYMELYWAGEDSNWEFAAYQLDKIRHTIELGIERRPKRGLSAQGFLQVAVPQLKEAIARKDQAVFREGFKAFTANCNACHVMEKMPFIQVALPQQRISPVKFAPASIPSEPSTPSK